MKKHRQLHGAPKPSTQSSTATVGQQVAVYGRVSGTRNHLWNPRQSDGPRFKSMAPVWGRRMRIEWELAQQEQAESERAMAELLDYVDSEAYEAEVTETPDGLGIVECIQAGGGVRMPSMAEVMEDLDMVLAGEGTYSEMGGGFSEPNHGGVDFG